MTTFAWLVEQLTAENMARAAQSYWTVPAGMVALYFYGVSHFNTPDYRLAILQSAESSALLTMTPPKYTTTRSRFRRYARWYVFILICAFLAFVFFTAVFSRAAHLLFNVTFDETTSLQSKVIFALFCLTGLLSSFPGFKDLDGWILTKLHQAALIPDDAKLMASRLFDADYQPPKRTREQVRNTLRSRDTLRYAEEKLVGALEHRVLTVLWLHSQLNDRTKEPERAYFASKFETDLTDIARNFTRMRDELHSYFKEQERLVPATVTDIDDYLSQKTENDDATSLIALRKDLLGRCDSLYYRMCLLTSLLVYSTEDTAEEIDGFLKKLGFAVHVQDNPIMDWDAVFRVVSSVFVLMLTANALFMGLLLIVGRPGNYTPDRSRLLIFAISTTLQYFIVLYATLKIKRRWRRRPHNRPENPLIAIFCYLLTVPISVVLSVWARHGEVSVAPLIYAANYGVVGYFIGTYIDRRTLVEKPFSWSLAAIQAAVQFAAALFIFFFAPLPKYFNPNLTQQISIAVFFACQSGLAGFLVGSLFQYFYRRTATVPGQAVGDITVEIQPAA